MVTEPSFLHAQAAVLDRYEVEAEQRFVEVPSVGGRAQALVAGEGPPAVMLNGIGTPAAMLAPLMAQLNGLRLYAVDLPGYGLTDTTRSLTDEYRSSATRFLTEVLDGLGLERPVLIANSLGSLWSSWLAIDRPERVRALVHVGCPAIVLHTSAPAPMRMLSVPGLNRLIMKLDPPSPKQVARLAKMVNEDPLPPTIAELLLATERLPKFEPTFLATLETLIRLRGSRPEMALTEDDLGRIEHPTLLIFAAADPFGAADVGERVARALPHSRLEIVDGGHAPWLRAADRIGPMVTCFLEELTVPS